MGSVYVLHIHVVDNRLGLEGELCRIMVKLLYSFTSIF